MGMGTYACFAEVVEGDFIKEVCPEKYNTLLDLLKEAESDLDEFSTYFDETYGYEEDIPQNESNKVMEVWGRIKVAYTELTEAFNKATGLYLGIRYHDAEDRGDEVDGGFWEVNGVYDYTPAGQKYKDKINRKFWTVYG